MALQNRSFAGAMYRFRNRVAQDILAERRRASLETALGVPAELTGGKFGEKDPDTGYQRYESAMSLEDAVAQLFDAWARNAGAR
jgi:hypothetical protein